MEATVRWAMLDQLRSPPAYFADAIRAHFRERKEAIVETVKGWIAFCKSKGYGGKASSMQTMLRDLEAELKKLK